VTAAPPPRRQFRLPGADEDFLDGLGLIWETIVEGQLRWLLLRSFPIPPGYGRTVADIAVLIQPGYPPGLIDSAYVYPSLNRLDGRVIPNAQGTHVIDGRTWQFWSRHRLPELNPWVEGEDDLTSHIHWMQSWLADEIERAT
jgi:Prokaryotic E2 family E